MGGTVFVFTGSQFGQYTDVSYTDVFVGVLFVLLLVFIFGKK